MKLASDPSSKPGTILCILRIIGCAVTIPLATVAILMIDNDEYIRRAWLEDFAGYDRQKIASHLPGDPDVSLEKSAHVKSSAEIKAWTSVDPQFFELPESVQIQKIESLLENARSGYPTPSLFFLRKANRPPLGRIQKTVKRWRRNA